MIIYYILNFKNELIDFCTNFKIKIKKNLFYKKKYIIDIKSLKKLKN